MAGALSERAVDRTCRNPRVSAVDEPVNLAVVSDVRPSDPLAARSRTVATAVTAATASRRDPEA